MMFYGFRTNTNNIAQIERLVDKMKQNIEKRANKIYCELLSLEITHIVDEIATNVYPRPERPIITEATELLNKKINVAMSKCYDTEYNFNASVNIFSYDKQTYIELAAFNENFYDAIKSIQGLTDMSVDELIDSGVNDDRRAIWQKIIKKYSSSSCMMIKLFPLKEFVQPKFSDMYFEPKEVRAETLARHKMTNQFLNQYAGGGTIPPHKLMEYLDQALLKGAESNSKAIYEDNKERLMQILPAITEEMVFGPQQGSEGE